jgi:CubicO group peptidase (beta-lactamase class C family)
VRPADQVGQYPGVVSAGAFLSTVVDEGLIPAAVLEVGSSAGATARMAAGCAEDAIFDLASLTKVLGPGVIALRMVGSHRLDLDDPVSRWVPAFRAADRADVRVRDLLTHSSGLPAHAPLYAHHAGADAVVAAAAATPLAAPPRTSPSYSDLGFIVLGRMLEAAGDAPLAVQVAEALSMLTDEPPTFGPITADARVQGTGHSAWRGRVLRGDVHDDNAAAMGGVAGHAGLFGTARGTGDVARAVLRGLRGVDSPIAPSWAFRAFARRSPVAGSSRALAWDTALPTSSSGRFLSRQAIGHTGFTGTSIWIDPASDLYIVLLTNRVAGRATADDMARIRRVVHESIGEPRTVSHDV